MTKRDIVPAVILIAVRFIANEGLLAVAISLALGPNVLWSRNRAAAFGSV